MLPYRQRYFDHTWSRLRSTKSADVFVLVTKIKRVTGDRAFKVAGPRAWNFFLHIGYSGS